MQTFLPYADFYKTAKCLDYKRLGKQRVEAWQIINILEGRSLAWRNHPAVIMWKGYADFLKLYFNMISAEWQGRGYQHNLGYYLDVQCIEKPFWFGDEEVHRSHQSNLLRKLPEHYGRYFKDIPNDLPYVWPKEKL